METTPICPGCRKPLPPNAPMGLCPACLMQGAFPTGTDAGEKAPRFVPPKIEELAAKFPQLEILEFIGQGGMGAVYKARQTQLDRIVALKILPPGIGDDPAFAERFAREARALAKLNHPGIVTIYEFGRADGLFFFLMEFVDGVTLRQLLNTGRVSPREALAIVPQICDALQFAHDQGIVHRDIKPENVLMDRRGRVKVADFGLAKLVGESASLEGGAHPVGTDRATEVFTEAGKVMGTPNYMAPEQMEHPADVDHRADIYALGVVFYQMLTGELPGKRIEAPSKKVRIDVRLDEVVMRALEQQPERRYQQASALKTQVETIADTAIRPPASIDGMPASAPLEKVLLGTATLILVGLAIVCSILALDYPAQSGLALTGGMLCFLGLGICGICFAGLWPFPDPFFPRPNFVSRNLSFQELNGKEPGVSRRTVVVGLLAAFLVIGVVAGYALVRKSNSPLQHLMARLEAALHKKTNPTLNVADQPQLLRTLPTDDVIKAGLGEPQAPWPWQELEQRLRDGQLNTVQANQIVDGLTQSFTNGFKQPLNWIRPLLDGLDQRGLVSQINARAFVEAFEGEPYLNPLPRFREDEPRFSLTCNLQNIWEKQLFGLEFLNEVQSITIDGQPVWLQPTALTEMIDAQRGAHPPAGTAGATGVGGVGGYFGNRDWSQNTFSRSLPLPPLSPGKHVLSCNIESALVALTNLTGLAHNAPSQDWPPALRRWQRNCSTELIIYAKDAEIVALSPDRALDPVANGSLSVQKVIVRRVNGRLRAVIVYQLDAKPGLPVSLDTTLRIAGQTVKCGSLFVSMVGQTTYSSGLDSGSLSCSLDSLDPQIKEAEIIFGPNPAVIASRPEVTRIWGKDAVFSHVPLVRQDLAGASVTSYKLTNSIAVKTIMLTRATNQFVGDSKDFRSVTVWTDSTLFPGEELRCLQRVPDGQSLDSGSELFVRISRGKTGTSCALTWIFTGAFGEEEVQAAVAQIRQTKSERPISLTAGQSLELFSVTNRYGGVFTGSMEYERSMPQPLEAGKKPQASIRLRSYAGSLLAFYSATVPAGYRLEATYNSAEIGEGEAHTSISDNGPADRNSSWYVPTSFTSKQNQEAVAQLAQLAEQRPLQIVLGEPRQAFAITNKAGEVYKGFFELVGPSADANK